MFYCMLLKSMLQLLFLLSLLKYSTLENPSTSHWDYRRHGPDTWQHLYDSCEGEAQSPVDIRTSCVRYDPHLSPLSLNGYTTNLSSYFWNFTHNGHTIIAYPSPLARLSISGANLPETFYLREFYFHWGYNPYQGSEHTINGFKYPLEIQFVHEGRVSKSLVILSLLFHLQADDNSYLNELLTILNQTINSSLSMEQKMNISYLFRANASPPRFYRYNGSLTNPPCTEGVIWIILARTVPISSYQLEIFSRNSIPFNFRPTQKLHSRRVIANFHPPRRENPLDEEDTCTYHSRTSIIHVSKFVLSFIFVLYMLK